MFKWLSYGDKDYFYKLYFAIRKLYNIHLKENDKTDSECKILAYNTILDDPTDMDFFEEYFQHRNLKSSDMYIRL